MPRNPKIGVVDPLRNGTVRNADSHRRRAVTIRNHKISPRARATGILFAILRSGIFPAQFCHVHGEASSWRNLLPPRRTLGNGHRARLYGMAPRLSRRPPKTLQYEVAQPACPQHPRLGAVRPTSRSGREPVTWQARASAARTARGPRCGSRRFRRCLSPRAGAIVHRAVRRRGSPCGHPA